MHDRAHERARGEVDRRVARGRLLRLRCRHRLPGEHALVALELAHLHEPHVGRDQIAHAEVHDVARHQLSHVQPCGVPSRRTTASWRMFAWRAATATSERYSLTKPSPDAQDDDRGDDRSVDGVTGRGGDAGGGEEQDQQGVAELAGEDAQRGDPVRRHDVRPERLAPVGGLGRGQPAFRRPEALEHLGHGLAGSPHERYRRRGGRHRSRQRRHVLLTCRARVTPAATWPRLAAWPAGRRVLTADGQTASAGPSDQQVDINPRTHVPGLIHR